MFSGQLFDLILDFGKEWKVERVYLNNIGGNGSFSSRTVPLIHSQKAINEPTPKSKKQENAPKTPKHLNPQSGDYKLCTF
jgi:hypothetical protein